MIPANTIDLTNYKISPLTMIFLIEGDKILTLKRNSNKKIYPNKLSGFGGKVEPGEDIVTSAQREFMEETGLTPKKLSLRGTYIRILDKGYINEMYLFIAEGFEGYIKETTEEGIIKWVTVMDFLQDADIVDHIPLYLHQIIEGKDFYCGIGTYIQDERISYTDNKSHFDERRPINLTMPYPGFIVRNVGQSKMNSFHNIREFGIKRENEERRDGGCGVVFDPKSQKYAVGKQDIDGLFRLFSGGVDPKDDIKDGVLREVVEESGLHEFLYTEKIAEAITHFHNPLRNVNRVGKATCFLVVLKSADLVPTQREAHEKFTLDWASAEEVIQNWESRNENKDYDHWIYFLKKSVARARELGYDKTSNISLVE